MQLMEMAQLVGLTIKNSPEGIAFDRAKKEYEGNLEINNALMEYQIQQALIQNKEDESGEPMDEATLARVNDRINELYEFIVGHEKYKAYEEAEKALNALIGKVNSTILAQITGKLPVECTHDCSSCGGCH
ncbi:MAG: YlbF family regulator [Eubacteriales bacterium]